MIFEDIIEMIFITSVILIMVLGYLKTEAIIGTKYENFQIYSSYLTSFSILSRCFPVVIDVDNETQIEGIRDCVYSKGVKEKIIIKTSSGNIVFKSKDFSENNVLADSKIDDVSKFYYPVKVEDEVQIGDVEIKKSE